MKIFLFFSTIFFAKILATPQNLTNFANSTIQTNKTNFSNSTIQTNKTNKTIENRTKNKLRGFFCHPKNVTLIFNFLKCENSLPPEVQSSLKTCLKENKVEESQICAGGNFDKVYNCVTKYWEQHMPSLVYHTQSNFTVALPPPPPFMKQNLSAIHDGQPVMLVHNGGPSSIHGGPNETHWLPFNHSQGLIGTHLPLLNHSQGLNGTHLPFLNHSEGSNGTANAMEPDDFLTCVEKVYNDWKSQKTQKNSTNHLWI